MSKIKFDLLVRNWVAFLVWLFEALYMSDDFEAQWFQSVTLVLYTIMIGAVEN